MSIECTTCDLAIGQEARRCGASEIAREVVRDVVQHEVATDPCSDVESGNCHRLDIVIAATRVAINGQPDPVEGFVNDFAIAEFGEVITESEVNGLDIDDFGEDIFRTSFATRLIQRVRDLRLSLSTWADR